MQQIVRDVLHSLLGLKQAQEDLQRFVGTQWRPSDCKRSNRCVNPRWRMGETSRKRLVSRPICNRGVKPNQPLHLTRPHVGFSDVSLTRAGRQVSLVVRPKPDSECEAFDAATKS